MTSRLTNATLVYDGGNVAHLGVEVLDHLLERLVLRGHFFHSGGGHLVFLLIRSSIRRHGKTLLSY